MIVELIKEDAKDYFNKKEAAATGVSKAFLDSLELVRGEMSINPKTGREEFRQIASKVPINRGKVVTMATDCFGHAFTERFGNDREYPEVGDVVIFTPNKSYALDLENKYHIVDDCEIIGFIKAGEYSNE